MEGFPFVYIPYDEDVVVLAGDIHNQYSHEEILDQIPPHIRVILVAGNHEFYHGEYHSTKQYLNDLAQVKYSNVTFLDNSSVVIDGVSFYGGMMCTDLELGGPVVAVQARLDVHRCINDFQWSSVQGADGDWRKWSINDHLNEHIQFRQGLQHWLRETEGQKRVVVSHFVPHPKAIHPRFAHSILNGYFTCDMERYMGWEGLWLFGHTHDSCDFLVGDTRCVSNPRGYGSENRHGFEECKLLEI